MPDVAAQPFATKERYGCGVPLAGAINQHKRTGLYAVRDACTGAPSGRALR